MSAISSSSMIASSKLSVLGNLACGLSQSDITSISSTSFL